MTNQERAAEVIGEWIDNNLPHSEDNFGADEGIAQALADAGLLMPDLPEPKWPGFWEVDGLEINLVDKDGEVLIEYGSDSEYIYGMQTRSLWLSRKQVLAILAAAKLAEERV